MASSSVTRRRNEGRKMHRAAHAESCPLFSEIKSPQLLQNTLIGSTRFFFLINSISHREYSCSLTIPYIFAYNEDKEAGRCFVHAIFEPPLFRLYSVFIARQ